MPIFGNKADQPWRHNPHASSSHCSAFSQSFQSLPSVLEAAENRRTTYNTFSESTPPRVRPGLPQLCRKSLLSPQFAHSPQQPDSWATQTQSAATDYQDSFLSLSPTIGTDKNSRMLYTDDEDPSLLMLSPTVQDKHSSSADTKSSQSQHMKSDLYRARIEEKWESITARRLLAKNRPKSQRPSLPPFQFPPSSPRTLQRATFPDLDALPELTEEASVNSDDSDVPASPESDQSNSMAFSHYKNAESDVDGWQADRLMHSRGRSRSKRDQPNMSRSRAAPFLSSGRRHSWSEPRLWTVYEDIDDEAGIASKSSSLVTPTLLRDKRTSCKRPASKSVHWNERVQVVEYGI